MESRVPEIVEAWMRKGRSTLLGGRKIFVIESGRRQAPCLFVLHGFPGSSFDFAATITTLGDSVRTVAFDMLGYGLSAKPFDAGYSLFEQADLAEAVAARTGIEQCVLLTHDMGSSVGAELMARSNEGKLPFEISQAIVTNGSIFIEMAELSGGQLALLSLPDEPLAHSLPMEGFKPGLRTTFSSSHLPTDEQLDAMIWLIQRNDGDRLLPRVIRYIEERRREQPRWIDGLLRFPGPMTVVWGQQDPIAVVAMAHRLAEMRPGTDLIVWEDVAHWPSIEAPQRLARVIQELFKDRN